MLRDTAVDSPVSLEWSVAARALLGEMESGDNHLVKALPQGVLIAVVDGLGHGVEAAEAGRAAVAALEAHADQSLTAMVEHCHEELKRTRGVVMTLAEIDAPSETLTWLGIGDVDGVIVRPGSSKREHLLMRGGVVGYQLPTLRTASVPMVRGDLLILATDGLRSGYAETLDATQPAEELANMILANFSRGTDDALVLVARYRGRKP
jgi:serine phosphatase RsbU (regulator of sigma subunit)